MKNTILSAIVLMTLALNACTEKAKQQETATTPPVATTPDEIVASSVSNKDGQKIDMAFNNTKSTATMQLNGETIELKQDTTASGIIQGNQIELNDALPAGVYFVVIHGDGMRAVRRIVVL